MSLNQSRFDKSESQARKPGRPGSSSHQRGPSRGGAKGAGGGSAPPPPSSSSSSSDSVFHPPPSNRRRSGNGQGGNSRVNPGSATSEVHVVAASAASTRGVQDGGCTQASSHGAHDVLAPGTAKPTESSASRIYSGLPRPPPPQSSAGTSDSASPTTPTKGGTSKAFTLQFGSISPGCVKGMQVPARTSSAPPNLDEQKRDQVIPTPPIPSVPKEQHQQPMKDVLSSNHRNVEDSHPPAQAKRDVPVQVPSIPSMATRKSSVPAPGVSVPMVFQQPQIPIQFGGPSPQMQSQGITGGPLQIPLSLSMGNAQVQQHIFAPSISSHTLPQGMHQGLGFAPQMGHQLASHMGNLGIGLPLQYAQQQAGTFVSVRKTSVRITHPDTHEELKLDKMTDSQPPCNVPSQTLSISSYMPSQQINCYQSLQPGSFNPGAFFLQTPTSIPLTSTPMTSGLQAARHGYQIAQSGTAVSFVNPQVLNHMPINNASSQLHGISEPVNPGHHVSHAVSVSALSAPPRVTVKPAAVSTVDKVAPPPVSIGLPLKEEAPNLLQPPGEGTASHQQRGDHESTLETSVQLPKSVLEPSGVVSVLDKDSQSFSVTSLCSTRRMQPIMPPLAPASVVDCASVVSSTDSERKDSCKSTDSSEDQHKMPSNRDIQQSQQQHQAYASDTADGRKFALSKESHPLDLNFIHASRNSEEIHVLSGGGETSTFTPSLPSPTVERDNSFGARLSANDVDKMFPISLEFSGIAIKEVLQDISPSISGSSKTAAADVLPGDIGSLETSTFCDVKEDGTVSKRVGASVCPKQDFTPTGFETKETSIVDEEHGKNEAFDDSSQGSSNAPGTSILASSVSVEQTEFAQEGAADVNLGKAVVNEVEPIEREHIAIESETTSWRLELNKEVVSDRNVSKPGCMEDSIIDVSKSEPVGTEGTMLSHFLSDNAHVDEASSLDALNNNGVTLITGSQEDSLTDRGVVSLEAESSPSVDRLEILQKWENVTEVSSGGSGSANFIERKERPSLEVNRAKKKKGKQVISKADAAGTNSDLCMAYKGPEEKHETVVTSECVENFPLDTNEVAACDTGKYVTLNEGDGKNKVEPDDWEEAADILTPKLRMSETGLPAYGKKKIDDDCGNGATNKKYSKDFLLTCREQCTDLPVGFEIGPDIADALMSVQVSTPHISDRKPFPSPGKIIDRPIGAIRDRRPVGLDDDKWTKASTPFGTARDIRADVVSFRPGQGVNAGVLRDHRGLSNPYDGGIFSGPMQTVLSLGGISRSNADADRWQHGPGIQRGLMPSPQTPLQVMHKAEQKYEVGKVSDKEVAKQRQLKSILNKLTPQNFDRLFEQVKEVNIDNVVTLTGVISQIFDKALMEPTFCEMYSNFCFHLAAVLPDFNEGDEKITFKRLLLNKCQEEFERGEREQDEANRAEEGEINRSAEERDEKKIKARRRMLGNIRLIGELYKKKMLTERIMHECIKKLLGQYQNPDEEDIEALCKLMSTIGEMIDHPKAKEHMDAYFDMMTKLSINQKLSSRVRFMLRDAIDLRRNKWQQRRKVEGPKKIEEVHRDAAQERQAQASRLARGPSVSSARRGPQPVDYGSRGSTLLPSPSPQSIGASGSFPSQGRVFGAQDVRLVDRHPIESRTPSVSSAQRPEDNPITLGPQGGLARGMSIKGKPLMPTVPLSGVPSKSGDSQRMASGLNSHSSLSDWTPYNSKDELISRHMQERHSQAPREPSKTGVRDHNPYLSGRNLGNADHAFDRSLVTTAPADHGPTCSIGSKNTSSEPKPLSEECLREKSISAIREFYSAKDEEEVALCVRELNSPNFYPAMVSLWVTDSFERKDIDRESLAKLLVSLTKPQDSLLSQGQLIQGFESVLFSLEDTVNDAPRAAEFLGGIFATVMLGNVISLREIGRLIRQGGEEPGRLLEIGLASEVLGSTLENIKTEKGNAVLHEIRSSSNLRLEDFQPPHPIKSKKLDAFL